MTRRIAALFGFIAFAGATIMGIFNGISPLTRIVRSGVAMLIAIGVGAVAGVIIERVVLGRFSQDWQEEEEPEA